MPSERSNHGVAILGMGRLGCALSEAFIAQNCRVAAVVSDFCGEVTPAGVEMAGSITDLKGRGPFALGVLTIAPEDAVRYHTLDDLFRVLKDFAAAIGDAPIAVVSGRIPLQQIMKAIGNKPFVRFACTCAVASTESLCLVDGDSDHTAKARLKLLLGHKQWKEVPRSIYEQQIKWLVAAALQCAVMAVYENLLNLNDAATGNLLPTEDIFQEAQRMVRARNGDAASAFWMSCTPGGMTREAASQIFGSSVVESLLRSNQ